MPVELAEVVDSPSRKIRVKVDRAPWWSKSHFLCVLAVLLGLLGTLAPKHGWVEFVRELRGAPEIVEPEASAGSAGSLNLNVSGWVDIRCKVQPDDTLRCEWPTGVTRKVVEPPKCVVQPGGGMKCAP